MAKKEEYQKKIEAMYQKVETDIEKLQAEIGQAEAEYAEHLEELASQKKITKQKMERLKEASAESWEQFRTEVEAALENLQKKFQQIITRILKEGQLSVGWAEGLSTVGPQDSKSWAEGLPGEGPQDSEGWVEGIGKKGEGSTGWPEGYEQEKQK